jgi:trehalose/maltose hydrolase-like predicted phosphorylase
MWIAIVTMKTSLLLLVGPTATAHIAPPSDWQQKIEAGSLFYSPSVENGMMLPFVGNGFIATHPHALCTSDDHKTQPSGTLFAAGVFNGGQFSQNRSHRAILPYSSTQVSYEGDDVIVDGYGLDVSVGVFMKRWHTEMSSGGELVVQESLYAHQSQRSLLVHEVTVENKGTLPTSLQLKHITGEPCGHYGCDVSFTANEIYVNTTKLQTVKATTNEAELPSSSRTTIGVASGFVQTQENGPRALGSASNGSIAVPVGRSTLYLVTAVATSLESNPEGGAPLDRAIHLAVNALSLPACGSLRVSHEAAWAARWAEGRVEVGGDASLAQAVNGSLYFILSSAREDWPYGLSPGGLASSGYHGHTFWDQETWMWPPINLFYPQLARSLLQYRTDRREQASAQARTRGWAGLMYPWESGTIYTA